MTNSIKKFKCEKCGEPFRTKYNYGQHMEEHLREERALKKSVHIGPKNKLAGMNRKWRN